MVNVFILCLIATIEPPYSRGRGDARTCNKNLEHQQDMHSISCSAAHIPDTLHLVMHLHSNDADGFHHGCMPQVLDAFHSMHMFPGVDVCSFIAA
jgi:hypothetical protein